MIIGLAGKMGSGKDYIAQKYIIPLVKKMGKEILQMSFADQIKINVMTNHNVPYDDVFVKKTQQTRKLLQLEGTERGRNVLGQDIWIKYFDAWSRVYTARGIDCIITTDIRFKNELVYIRENNGIVIKVVSEERNKTRLQEESKGDIAVYDTLSKHSSECDLDEIENDEYDMVVQNDEGQFDACVFENELESIIQKMLDKVVHNSF
jgi:phosphomevalonate kinase